MKQKLKIALMILVIVAVGIISLGIKEKPYVLNFEVYKTLPGDTFWGVTRHYYNLDERNIYFLEYQDEIRELNPQLKETHYQIEPNDLIKVRYVTWN